MQRKVDSKLEVVRIRKKEEDMSTKETTNLWDPAIWSVCWWVVSMVAWKAVLWVELSVVWKVLVLVDQMDPYFLPLVLWWVVGWVDDSEDLMVVPWVLLFVKERIRKRFINWIFRSTLKSRKNKLFVIKHEE